jgi:hypothetical protein
MTIDELELVRRLGDVDPLSAEATDHAEVLLRAAMAVPGIDDRTVRILPDGRVSPTDHGRRSWRVLAAVAASALALVGAGIGWAVTGSPGHAQPDKIAATPTAVLTAAEVHLIASRSNSAASSGSAEVTETSTLNGAPQDGYDLAVTFSGQNIDEKITSVPEPASSAKSFTTDDRFVSGQFYIYTPGPNDVPEWLHDTDSADDAASMQFPEPRSLYAAISPQAQFTADGTATINGVTVTKLVAGAPSAISSASLGNLTAGSTLTSFTIWVDADKVVQQIALSTTATSKACSVTAGSSGLSSYQSDHVGSTKNELEQSGSCSPQVTNSRVTVAFAGLGVPQSVTPPQGAVDFVGKG